MKEEELHNELSSIRSMMERSSKFISLSGLSGILAGVYALIGAAFAWIIIYYDNIDYTNDIFFISSHQIIALLCTGLAVLILSIITGYLLSIRKAKRKGESVWNKTSRLLLLSVSIPLLIGGVITSSLFYKYDITYVAAVTLIFYGLALFNASNFTYNDVKYLGIVDIIIGLVAGFFPKYSLLFWAIGFGVLHIIYGSIMYLKYDR